jgi:hypothetical protein
VPQSKHEIAIDSAQAANDLDSIIKSVIAHVRTRYRRAPYTNGSANDHLANQVALQVHRRLTGDTAVKQYDPSRGPLSHLVNVIAKSTHLNELSAQSNRLRHETVTDDETLHYISDLKSTERPILDDRILVDRFITSLPASKRDVMQRCLKTQSISAADRHTFRHLLDKASAWVPDVKAVDCDCWNCTRAGLPRRRPRSRDDEAMCPIRVQRYR